MGWFFCLALMVPAASSTRGSHCAAFSFPTRTTNNHHNKPGRKGYPSSSSSRATWTTALYGKDPFDPNRRSSTTSNINGGSSSQDTSRQTSSNSNSYYNDIYQLQESLKAVRHLPRLSPNMSEDPLLALQVDEPSIPTFRRLFTHTTWAQHLGGRAHGRWWRAFSTIHKSEIIRSIYPICCLVTIYSTAVSVGLKWLWRKFNTVSTVASQYQTQQNLSLSLAAHAISLLLVFRTNNAYRRLEEARELWGRVIYLTREMVAVVAASWNPLLEQKGEDISGNNQDADANETNTNNNKKGPSTRTVVRICRYLASFSWSLRDQLRTGDERQDILQLLMPSPDEAAWVAQQRSRPLAIHSRLRRIITSEYSNGRLSANLHFMLESHLKELAQVVADCERIFTSPIPPAMSRHGTRSVMVFFLTMPVVFSCGTSSPGLLSAAWTFVMAFLFLGIEELGVQVGVPNEIVPFVCCESSFIRLLIVILFHLRPGRATISSHSVVATL